jgi:hypothetical protein
MSAQQRLANARAAIRIHFQSRFPAGGWLCQANQFSLPGIRSKCAVGVLDGQVYCNNHITHDFSGDVATIASFANVPNSRWEQGVPLGFDPACKCDAGAACPWWATQNQAGVAFIRCVACPARYHAPNPELTVAGVPVIVDGKPITRTCVPPGFLMSPNHPSLGACPECVLMERHMHFTSAWCFQQAQAAEGAGYMKLATAQFAQQQEVFAQLLARKDDKPPTTDRRSEWNIKDGAALLLNDVDKVATKRIKDCLEGYSPYTTADRALPSFPKADKGTLPTDLVPSNSGVAWACIRKQITFFDQELDSTDLHASDRTYMTSTKNLAVACLRHGSDLEALEEYGFRVAWMYCVALRDQHRRAQPKPTYTTAHSETVLAAVNGKISATATTHATQAAQAAISLLQQMHPPGWSPTAGALSQQVTPLKGQAPGVVKDSPQGVKRLFDGESRLDRIKRNSAHYAAIGDGSVRCYNCTEPGHKSNECSLV